MWTRKNGAGLMAEPYLKAVPNEETGHLHFVMDREGHELFQRLLARAKPSHGDSAHNFNKIKDRVDGAFLAGGLLMGWKGK